MAIRSQFQLSISLGFASVFWGCQNKVTVQTKQNIKELAPLYTPSISRPAATPISISAYSATYLKARVSDSGSLSEAEKCPVAAGTMLFLAALALPAEKEHEKVVLATNLPGCGLQSGYIYKPHFAGAGIAQVSPSGTDECGIPAEVDTAKAAELAQYTLAHKSGSFGGDCYKFVADNLEATRLMPVGTAAWAAAGVKNLMAASGFATVEQSSLAGNFVRIRPKGWGCVPKGAILSWKEGRCGFHPIYGHIEVMIQPNKSNPAGSNLCSDGCQGIDTSCNIESDVAIFMPRKK